MFLDFSRKREKLRGHNSYVFPLQQSCTSSLRVAWSTDGNMHEDCCLTEFLLQIFPAIQSLVISLSIFNQFQNKLTTIATFFTWQKEHKPKKQQHSFLPVSPSTAVVSVVCYDRFPGVLLAA